MRSFLLATIAILLAGCTSNDPPPSAGEDPPGAIDAARADDATGGRAGDAANTTTPVRPETTRYEGAISGAWTGGQLQLAHGTWAPVAFDVPSDATGVVVELVWETQPAPIDLDLVVTLPDDTTREHLKGAPGFPDDGYADVRLLDADVLAGAHAFLVRCKVCAAQAYEVYVTTFAGGPPPEGFTGTGEANARRGARDLPSP